MAPADSGDPMLVFTRRVDEAHQRLAHHAAMLKEAFGDIRDLKKARAGAGGEDKPPLPSWLLVEDESAAVGMLDELVGWVDAVYLRFEGAALPSCWLRHPDLVEELLALAGAWVDAYEGPKRSWKAVCDWMAVRRRFVSDLGLLEICEVEEHQEGHKADRPAKTAPLRSQIEPIAHAWATSKTLPPVTEDEIDQAKRHAYEQASNTS